mmetsp:Transcript_73971/g.158529  ORF Transcript_73971/g.158529 Transcript_73971/m.158529 type:complete len:231 (-) Transcript_73971:77-769(-)
MARSGKRSNLYNASLSCRQHAAKGTCAATKPPSLSLSVHREHRTEHALGDKARALPPPTAPGKAKARWSCRLGGGTGALLLLAALLQGQCRDHLRLGDKGRVLPALGAHEGLCLGSILRNEGHAAVSASRNGSLRFWLAAVILCRPTHLSALRSMTAPAFKDTNLGWVRADAHQGSAAAAAGGGSIKALTRPGRGVGLLAPCLHLLHGVVRDRRALPTRPAEATAENAHH